ncbi:MAG: class I SAM-dependent methyltransferase [Gemmatimonadaceae bacterium]
MTTDFEYSGTELDSLADARNYYRAILDRFVPWLGGDVVEVGAGIGTFAERLIEHAPPRSLTLIEPGAGNAKRLAARFAGDACVRSLAGYLEDHVAGLQADAVVMVNVPEHVQDDRALFANARQVLRPGGHLLLFVPALPWLFGSLDEAFGHYRRYTRPRLRAALEDAGLEPVRMHYMNVVGVIPWFIAGRIARRRTLHPADVRIYDRFVTPIVSRIERIVTPPFGQSILAVARRAHG